MNAVALIQRRRRHWAWVNGNLLTAATTLSEVQLRSAFQIGQGSIWMSRLHFYATEYVWLEALLDDDDPLLPGDLSDKLPGTQQGQRGITGLDDLRQKWSTLERRWAGYLASLTPEPLEEIVHKGSTRSGLRKRWGTRRSDVLLHVCTHAYYTAAQVVNMRRQADADKLPETMLISLARHEATVRSGHGHEVVNLALPDDDFNEAFQIAQAAFDRHQAQVIVGLSRGGAVAMNIDSVDVRLALLCPAWKQYGSARTVLPGTVILPGRADDVVPFADSEELVKHSGLPPSALVEVGNDYRLADPKPLGAILRGREQRVRGCWVVDLILGKECRHDRSGMAGEYGPLAYAYILARRLPSASPPERSSQVALDYCRLLPSSLPSVPRRMRFHGAGNGRAKCRP